MRRIFYFIVTLIWLGCLVLSPALFGQEGAGDVIRRITYTKAFPGSVPEYISILIVEEGWGTYEGGNLNKPSKPSKVQWSRETVERVFELSKQLGYFQDLHIPSKKRVANLGEKTLSYEGPEGKYQVVFNYTKDPMVRELVGLFEAFSKSHRHLAQLEHEVKFDRLALAGHLRRIQVDLSKNALGEPKLLIPALRQIASSGRYMNMARTRARSILERLEQMESSE